MLNLVSKFRLLPVTIFAASLMLSVKVTDIFDGFEGPPGGLPVASAVAQQKSAPEDKAGEAAPGNGEDAKADANEKDDPPAGNPAIPDPTALSDPTLLTQSEIDLLQQLADRREALESRAEELDLREGFLAAAEERINRKIAELKNLETTLQGLVKTNEDQQNEQVKSLVRIYENMKPKEAARIFETLDLDTLLLVAVGMK